MCYNEIKVKEYILNQRSETKMKKELMEIKKEGNALVKKVVNVILDQDPNYQEGFIGDVINHGCSSGIVGELIYYSDTTAFYSKYKREIISLLKETMSDFGYKSPAELFTKNWDDEDPLVEDTHNQNLLAWFAFEETCRMIANRLEIE